MLMVKRHYDLSVARVVNRMCGMLEHLNVNEVDGDGVVTEQGWLSTGLRTRRVEGRVVNKLVQQARAVARVITHERK
jgi:hypothetical protein